ncbi:hypothetical protein Tco_0178210 [Tanacetum coccineum]
MIVGIFSLSSSGEFSVKDTRLAIDDLVLPSHSEPTRYVLCIVVCRWWESIFSFGVSCSEWTSGFSSIRLPVQLKVFWKESSMLLGWFILGFRNVPF